MQKVWIIWSHLLIFNFKSFVDADSLLFINFQWILRFSRVLSSENCNFYKLKGGEIISGGNQFCRKSELSGPPFCISIWKVLWTQILGLLQFLQIKERGPIWSPLLCFNFKGFMDPNYFFLIRFQCILHDSGVIFSEFCNFYKLKCGDLISGAKQFYRKFEFFGPRCGIWILKVLSTQIYCRSLEFNEFCMMQWQFSQGLEVSTN